MNAETGGSLADDRGLIGRDGGSGTKSPWKITPSPAVTVDAPIMGAHSWPALADAAQQPRSKNPPPLAPTSTPTPAQPVDGQAKPKAGGKAIPGHKNLSGRHSKSGSRINQNVPPPYPVHAVPYHPLPFLPMVPLPYAAPYYPYPIPGAPISEPGNEKQVQASPRPSVLPAPQGNPGQPWQHQRGFDPRNMPQGAGPWNFVRPPYMAPAPGFLVGPAFPGLVNCLPAPPPGDIRGPYPPRLAPCPVNQGPPEKPDLKDRVLKQIEYYFSDENLEKDKYLISLMDRKGWVPTKIIAGFKRVKAMTMNLEFIVYALGFSTSVEVQDDKIRKRDKWYKWVPAFKRSASEEKIEDSDKDSPEIITSGDNSGNPSKGSIKPFVCDCSSEGAQSSRTNNYESDNLKSSADEKINVDDLSSDFVNSVLLDKELELEHRNARNSGLSMSKSIENEDDDTAVDGQDIQKHVIVTQNNGKSDGTGTSGTRGKNIPKEVASTINDGLSVSKSIENEDDDTAFDGQDTQKHVTVTQNNGKSDGTGTSGTRGKNIPKEVASTINNGLSVSKSIDDDMAVDDQGIQKLVTQNNGKCDGTGTSGTRGKNIPKEVASTINDGLYYFEQEIKQNRSGRWKNNSHLDCPLGVLNDGVEEHGIINHKAKGKQVSLMM